MTTMNDAASRASLFVTATGCCEILKPEHFMQMRNNAICCNIGHFDCEVDVAWLESNCKKVEIKPQVIMYSYSQEVKNFAIKVMLPLCSSMITVKCLLFPLHYSLPQESMCGLTTMFISTELAAVKIVYILVTNIIDGRIFYEFA